MKKSKIIRKLTALLRSYEDSELGPQQAREILDLLEKEGMKPPFTKQRDLGCECGCHGWCAKGYEWDYEHDLTGEFAKDGRYGLR